MYHRKRFLVFMTPCFKGSSRKKGRFLDIFKVSVFIFTALDLIITSQCLQLSWRKWRMPTDSYATSDNTGISMQDANLIILLGAKNDHRCYKAEVWGDSGNLRRRKAMQRWQNWREEVKTMLSRVTDISTILFSICSIVVEVWFECFGSHLANWLCHKF